MKACRKSHMLKTLMVLLKPDWAWEGIGPWASGRKIQSCLRSLSPPTLLKISQTQASGGVISFPFLLDALEFSSKRTVPQIPISRLPLSDPLANCLCSKNTNRNTFLDRVHNCASLHVYIFWRPSWNTSLDSVSCANVYVYDDLTSFL